MHKEVNKWLLRLADEALEENGEGLTAAKNDHIAGYKGSIWKIFWWGGLNKDELILGCASTEIWRRKKRKKYEVSSSFAVVCSVKISYQEGSLLSVQVSRGSIYVKWLLRNSARSCFRHRCLSIVFFIYREMKTWQVVEWLGAVGGLVVASEWWLGQQSSAVCAALQLGTLGMMRITRDQTSSCRHNSCVMEADNHILLFFLS